MTAAIYGLGIYGLSTYGDPAVMAGGAAVHFTVPGRGVAVSIQPVYQRVVAFSASPAGGSARLTGYGHSVGVISQMVPELTGRAVVA